MALGKDDLARAFGAEFVEGLGCAVLTGPGGLERKINWLIKWQRDLLFQAAFFLGRMSEQATVSADCSAFRVRKQSTPASTARLGAREQLGGYKSSGLAWVVGNPGTPDRMSQKSWFWRRKGN